MKRIALYLSLTLLTACGTDSNDAQSLDGTVTDESEAMLIEKKEGLPECNEGLHRQLAYVTENEEFYTCTGKEWKAVTIKGTEGKDGKDGQDGAIGKDGLSGKDGLAGKDGTDGTAGKDGKDAKALASTEWEHPLTGALWFLTGQYFNQKQTSSCPEGARFPTQEEWGSAFESGLTNKLGVEFLNVKQRAWISADIYVQLYIGATELDIIGTQTARDSSSSLASLNYRALCIKE